jgi:tryptophan halogenase
VRRVEGRLADVEQDAETGHIRSLTLADGQRIEGEFFVDCTGFAAELIGKALDVPFEDWTRWLPCDSAMAVPRRAAGRPRPLPGRAR